jgi:hypothetical protein
MKALYLVIFMCLVGLWIVSCQKEYSCERCTETGNQFPIARAGFDKILQLPADSILLDGSASSDPDGQITAYAWSVISGPLVYQFDDLFSAKTIIKNLAAGSYLVELMITDNNGATTRDTLAINVLPIPGNIPPVAIAGMDETILLPADSASLDGTSSFDPDGSIVTYEWAQLDGPAPAIIKDINSTQTLVTIPQEGTYHFRLKVTDNKGSTAEDTIQWQLLKPVAASGGFTFNLAWTCKDRCDDNDVFVSILEGFNLFADPNIPMEVSVMEDNNWIPVPQYKVPLPAGSKYYYLVSQRTLFVYRAPIAGASSFIGKPTLVKVKFI